MKLSTMRSVDRYIGVPVCFVLGWMLWLVEAVFRRGTRRRPRRVLFIELSEMGSTILASPAITWLRERLGGEKPCFVIFRKNVDSLRVMKLFDDEDVFTIRDTSLSALAVDLLGFVRFCQQKRIDTVVDLELYSRISAILSILSGARTRVRYRNYLGEGLYRGASLTHRVNYNPYYHMSQNFMALVQAVDCDPDDVPLPKAIVAVPVQPISVPRDPIVATFVRGELQRCFDLTPEHRLVIVNHDAGALIPVRSWPVERFAELTRRLLGWSETIVVVLIGVPPAMGSARWVTDTVRNPRCVNFVGRTRTVADVVQLLHEAELLITNDSGPAHFASLTGIPTVTLFGPETPQLYGALGAGAVNLYKPLACSPCLMAVNHRNTPCTNNVCLRQISVDEVFENALRLLNAGCAGTGA